MKTATQIIMDTMTDADAFGPDGIKRRIGDRDYYVRREGNDWSLTDMSGHTRHIVTDSFEFIVRHIEEYG